MQLLHNRADAAADPWKKWHQLYHAYFLQLPAENAKMVFALQKNVNIYAPPHFLKAKLLYFIYVSNNSKKFMKEGGKLGY